MNAIEAADTPMFQEYPIYVEDDVEPFEARRANGYQELQTERADAGRGRLGKNYYVVDPTHSITGNAAGKNICDPDDADARRARTLAFLAPQMPFSLSETLTISAALNVKQPKQYVRDDERVWREYLRAQCAMMDPDSRHHPSRNKLATDEDDIAIIQATRAAHHRFKTEQFKDKSLNTGEFRTEHVRHQITHYGGAKKALADELDGKTVEELFKFTAPPKLPKNQAEQAVYVAKVMNRTYLPEDNSAEGWCRDRGLPEHTWGTVNYSFEGWQLYSGKALGALEYGEELLGRFEAVTKETFPVWYCPGCGEKFHRQGNRNKHINDGHCPELDTDERPCPFCDEHFEGENAGMSLGAHMRSHDINRIEARRDVKNKGEYGPGEPDERVEEPAHQPSPEPEPGSLQAVYADGGPDIEYTVIEATDEGFADPTASDPEPDDSPAISDETASDISDIAVEMLLDEPTTDLVRTLVENASEDQLNDLLSRVVVEPDVDTETVVELRGLMD